MFVSLILYIHVTDFLFFLDTQYNVTVKNAWKIHEVSRDKWYLLVARSPADKDKWMKALVNERKRVKEDQENSTLYFLRFYGHVHFS